MVCMNNEYMLYVCHYNTSVEFQLRYLVAHAQYGEYMYINYIVCMYVLMYVCMYVLYLCMHVCRYI